MPARTDHDRRDAQHSARVAVAEALGRYVRRITEEAYAEIEKEAADYDGAAPVDWSAVGRAAAHRALTSYGVTVAPERALEAPSAALEAGAGAGSGEADA